MSGEYMGNQVLRQTGNAWVITEIEITAHENQSNVKHG